MLFKNVWGSYFTIKIILSFSVTSVHALETTLQTVEMSFEKCLTVIDIVHRNYL